MEKDMDISLFKEEKPMTRARNQLISLDTTPYYHCISRCVRRAFLWGEDSLTGKNYEHRKEWVITRLHELSEIFAIDICAYAIMSNHYHLVLRVDQQKAAEWSSAQVAEQWEKLHQLPLLINHYLRNQTTTKAEIEKAEQTIETWRERLTDISWFMRSLNEHLARKANEEDCCTGRFWEGRFKSQALLDEAALLTCMSYVDLNPVRAGTAKTPEESDYTSIQQRIRQHTAASAKTKPNNTTAKKQPPLMPLVKQNQDQHKNAIGFTLMDYLELTDWAGRAVRENKRGAIPQEAPPILQRLGLEPRRYLEHLQGQAETEKPTMLGHIDQIRQAANALGRSFIKGAGEAQRLYRTA
jgi:REP element-mobilizing transposase RayT